MTEFRSLSLLRSLVSECLQKEENKKEFEDWYLKQYGIPYIWKTKKE